MGARIMQTYTKFLTDPSYADITNAIYRFKNTINGKVYTGQTRVSVRKRVIQHVTRSRPWTKVYKSYFHNALNRYGFDNFEFSIIELCSEEELDERERYWISYYKATDKIFGYNIDSGGQVGKTTSPLTEAHKAALLKANLGKHRSEKTKLAISIAHKAIAKTNPSYMLNSIKNLKEHSDASKITVYQYSLSGDVIKKWPSISDVNLILYGDKRRSGLTRNIKTSMKKMKLGFSKNNAIWSFLSPEERGPYRC